MKPTTPNGILGTLTLPKNLYHPPAKYLDQSVFSLKH